jgi:hypothetical protein
VPCTAKLASITMSDVSGCEFTQVVARKQHTTEVRASKILVQCIDVKGRMHGNGVLRAAPRACKSNHQKQSIEEPLV